ncbi:MAG: hypothetical protein PUC34_08075 [Paludibacteraceae bacterium]|nr:hypothetical protein [Paludibacteraceae bacterium]
MRKKLTILFALLCASMMGWAYDLAPNTNFGSQDLQWQEIDGVTPPANVVNVQSHEGYDYLYITFSDAGFNRDYIGGGAVVYTNDGAQAWLQLKSFTNQYTDVLFYQTGSTTDVKWGLRIYNAAAGGGGSTPDPDPDPTPDPDPNSYTAGGHTIHLEAYHVNDIYTLNITSTDNMEGLGGSFWNVNGVGADMRSNSGENSYTVSGDKKTITCQVQSSSAPNIYTPLYVLMPGEVNFGNVTLNWEDRTPITSEYCNYQGPETQQDGHYYAISFETDPSGNVVITIGNGTGAGACSFRNGGFEGGNNGLDNFVVSDDNFATTTPAADYFTVTCPSDGDLQYVLTKIADLPAGAKIKHLSAGAIAWREAGTDRWCNPEFIYTYGGTCNKLDAPTNVKIDASNILTFDVVYGAETYTAYVSLGGVEKYSQAVVSGDALTYTALVTGDYIINVVASGAGKVDSDPSADVVWHLEAAPVVLGNSEYCEKNMSSGSTEAAFTWETDANGNIVITISEVLNGSNAPAHFRANAFKDGIKVGASKESLSTYFNIPATIAGEDHSQQSLTYTLIDPANAPARGEKIYYHGVVEYRTSENTDAWPTLDFEYTYGTVCSGKSVSATSNNATMGSAVAKVGEDEVTSVDEGTEVAFIATANPGYVFVNWTKGGVEVSTKPVYELEINETTNLVANFDYARTTYCHTAVTTNGGKKLYLTVGKGATEGTYQIKIYGSDELTITGINNANTAMNFIKFSTYDGNDVPLNKANEGWTFSASGYGVITSAEIQPRTGYTWRDMWMWRPDLYIGTDAGEQNINSILSQEHHFNWNNECSDAEAPAFNKAEAEVLNESSVRLKIQATDNWGGLLTYTIAREAAEPIISNHASGEEFTQDVTGLTAGTKYTFTVTVSDGVNNVSQNIVVTPMGDSEPPVMGEARLESNTWNSAIINVAATDNKGVTAYYVVEKAADYIATDGKITVEGLTAATPYTFRIKAKDAAGNISENQAEVSFTTDAHLLAPTTAATAPTWPANQVKSLYSNTYDFAPASLSSYNECWWNCPNMSEGNIDGNTYLLYDLYRNGIIGAEFAETPMSLMEKIHIDIWASAAGSIKFRPITNGGPNTPKTLNLAAQQWNSFDIDLSEYAGHDWSKVFQFAIEGYQDGGLVGEHISVDNIFFYRTTPPPADLAAPINVSASVAARGFNSVKITAQAEDNSGAVSFKVLNGESILATGSAATGVSTTITISSLTPGTNYNLNVIAYDEAGNEASPVAVATSTKALPSPAPMPNFSNKNVVPVFTDAMAGGKTDIHSGGWGETTKVEWLDIAEGDKVFYGQNFNYAGWHSWGGGNINATGMQYLHVDVYSIGATSVNVTPISPGHEGSATITLTPNAWTSYDVPLSAYDANNIDWANIFQFKFMNPIGGNELLIDNVYFWQQTTRTTPVKGGDEATGGWATFASPVKVAVPSGLKAYKATYSNEGGDEQLVLDAVSGAIPANEGVLLRGEADHVYTFSPTNDEEGDYTGNALKGCPVRTDITSVAATNDIFCLRYSELYSLTGFFIYSGQYIAAGKAYLPLPKAEPSSAPRRIRFVFREEQGTTGFDPTNAEAVPTTKFIENGQLYIRRGDAVYTIQGVRVK